jgi:HK97 family phage portal protein
MKRNFLSGLYRSLDTVLTGFSNINAPQDWLTQSFILPGGDSGVPVTEKSIQQITAFSSGVRLLSESLGTLSVKVLQETENDIRVLKNHPAYHLICKKPNSFQTSQIFWETCMRYCILRGNFFAVIIRDADAKPTELLPVHESKLVNVYFSENRLYYKVQGIDEMISSENMLHFKGLGDGRIGISCLEYAMTSAGVTLASQKNQAKFYKGGSQLDGVLEHPKSLSSTAAATLRDSWHSIYQSGDSTARVAVLSEGMQYRPISVTPEAAKYLETLKEGNYDIARILRVPPHMIMLLDRSTLNNIEHQGLEYVKYSLLPWISRFEAECWDKLLTEQEKKQDEIKIKFNLEVLLRGDYKTRIEGYQTAINAGIMSQNDARKLESMPPFEGGDRKWIMMNMMPLDMADEILLNKNTNGTNQTNS